MEDRRSIKTKKAIKQAFFYLLKTKCVGKMSVSEITTIANIGRGTFYLHYLDVYDLQEKVEDDICLDILTIFEQNYTGVTNFKSLYLFIFDYILEHYEHLSLLLSQCQQTHSSQLMQKIRGSLIEKVYSIIPKKLMLECYKTEIPFIISGLIGVTENWLLSETKRDINIVSDELNKILLLFGYNF